MSYARANIARIAGYTPGEQPKGRRLIKLNTNENPYPPSAGVIEALRQFPAESLKLYPVPAADPVREAAAELFGLQREQVLCGNGSDDLLTIALRSFVDQGGGFAYTEPSYSLYPVLADIQGARKIPVALDEQFMLPTNAAELAAGATLFMLARPNAPTGNSFPKERVAKLCREFPGVVWVDEAYGDFAQDNCIDLLGQFPNLVVSRTLSKSYSLAGLRLGMACAAAELIVEMDKVRDSYNIDMITQALACAALKDSAAMRANVERICAAREKLRQDLQAMGCEVLPSEANFLFMKPPMPAAELFQALREQGFLVRYFNLPRISEYLRITIGGDEDMAAFCACCREILAADK
jgi:histidinol-phosphate aminotransferase